MSRWEALGILMVLAFLNYMDRNLLPPALNAIKADLHLSGSEAGALATGFFAVYACTAPIAGYMADRLPRKRILLFAVVLWSIVTALSGTATGFMSLLIWRACTGFGEGGYFPTALSLIGDLFDPRQRGRAIALHGMCTTLGGAAGLALGGVLVGSFGWRMPFFLAIVPGLLLATVLWFRFQEPVRGQREAGPPPDPNAPRRTYFSIALSTPVLLISVAAFAASFSTNALTTFMPTFLQDAHHMSEAEAGVLTGIGFGATMVGQLSGGFASDGFASRMAGARPLLVGCAYLLTVPAMLAIAYAGNPTLAVVAYALTQVGRGFGEPNLYGTIMDAVAPHERGTAQGFLLAMTFAGSTLGPWVSGALQDAEGGGFTWMLQGLAGAAAISVVASLALFRYLRKRATRTEPAPDLPKARTLDRDD
jgi:MFS transporter, Spinster family, sphingosine-1-phosphate transporter